MEIQYTQQSEKLSKVIDQLYEAKAEEARIKDVLSQLKQAYNELLPDNGENILGTTGKFNFTYKYSKRKGSLDEKSLINSGVDIEEFRKPPTQIRTFKFVEPKAEEQ